MSLYDQLGGAAAVDAAVEKFYQKVLNDDSISQFFLGADTDKLAKMQKNFLTYAFGGPNEYAGKGMREAHKHLVEKGLNEAHFDIVVSHLATTLKELGVADELIAKAGEVANSVKDDVLCR